MRCLLAATLVLLVHQPLAQAQTATVSVSGKHSVYFAGQESSELSLLSDFYGDPANVLPGLGTPASPQFLRDLNDSLIIPNAFDIRGFAEVIDITGVGTWGHNRNLQSGPDGREGVSSLTVADYSIFGISRLEANLNSLMGVFLAEGVTSPPAPGTLSQVNGDSMRRPDIGQAFAIGRNLENITVPDTATHLYLGLHDGDDWTNNVGTVDATISARPVLNLDGLQQRVLDEFTVAPTPSRSSVNVYEDFVDDRIDSTWSTLAGGISTFNLVAEFGDGEASFGIYDLADTNRRAEVFSGNDSVGAKATVALDSDGTAQIVKFDDLNVPTASSDLVVIGSQFGFYLDSPRNGVFFSDTSQNPDDFDHMLAYQGKSADTVQLPGSVPGLWTDTQYLFAWEDLPEGGDRDYEDFVVFTSGVQPIPEPSTILIWVALLSLAIAVTSRREALNRCRCRA